MIADQIGTLQDIVTCNYILNTTKLFSVCPSFWPRNVKRKPGKNLLYNYYYYYSYIAMAGITPNLS